MRYRLALVFVVGLTAPTFGFGQERVNIMNEKPVASGPTYKQLVETFFAEVVFPAELSYGGIGLKRDNVIAERIETNGRGGYWISVRARYSGKAGAIPVPVAERVHVHYDNGGVRADLGGLKGVLNTKDLGSWIKDKLPGAEKAGKAPEVAKGAIRDGDVVHIRTRPKYYWSCWDSTGGVKAIEKGHPDPKVSDELFTIREVGGGTDIRDGDQVYLVTRRGRYLNAHDSRGEVKGIETISKDKSISDEIFTVITEAGGSLKEGDRFYLRTRAGYWLNSTDGKGKVQAIPTRSTDPAISDELFTVCRPTK